MAWSVGSVQTVRDGVGNFSGAGFVIHDEHNRPVMTLGFLTETEAKANAEKMRQIISAAAECMRTP